MKGQDAGKPFVLTKEHILMTFDLLWAATDNSRALRYCAPEFRCYLPGRPVIEGGEAMLETVNMVRRAQPDVQIEWHDLIIEGSTAALHLAFRGHHLGPLFGVPPTGRLLEIDEIFIQKYDERGRVTEARQQGDYVGMLSLMGIMPPPGAGPLTAIGHSVRSAWRLTMLDRRYRKRNGR